eukprot:UN06529
MIYKDNLKKVIQLNEKFANDIVMSDREKVEIENKCVNVQRESNNLLDDYHALLDKYKKTINDLKECQSQIDNIKDLNEDLKIHTNDLKQEVNCLEDENRVLINTLNNSIEKVNKTEEFHHTSEDTINSLKNELEELEVIAKNYEQLLSEKNQFISNLIGKYNEPSTPKNSIEHRRFLLNQFNNRLSIGSDLADAASRKISICESTMSQVEPCSLLFLHNDSRRQSYMSQSACTTPRWNRRQSSVSIIDGSSDAGFIEVGRHQSDASVYSHCSTPRIKTTVYQSFSPGTPDSLRELKYSAPRETP